MQDSKSHTNREVMSGAKVRCSVDGATQEPHGRIIYKSHQPAATQTFSCRTDVQPMEFLLHLAWTDQCACAAQGIWQTQCRRKQVMGREVNTARFHLCAF